MTPGATGQADFIWQPNDQPAVVVEEFAAAEIFRSMLADPEWLIPLVAAQVQYRSVYYALTAAALLEDVWTDALSNWLARHRPSVRLTKVTRGALGDYMIDNWLTSHKSGRGPVDTAIHWDATSTRGPHWVSDTAVTYLSADYGHLRGRWTSPEVEGVARVVWPVENGGRSQGLVALVSALDEDRWRIVHTWEQWPAFDEVWPYVAQLLDRGTPAYEIEMFWLPNTCQPGQEGTITFSTWPGVYLWPKNLLVDVPLSSNNRGSTLKSSTVAALMKTTRVIQGSDPLFVPMPVWSARYAPPRPPDLYLTLRSVWDQRFSPVTQIYREAST